MELIEKLLNHYKETYYFEIDRRDKINSNLNIPITIFILVVGTLSYYLNNLPNLDYDFMSVFFLISIFALTINTSFSFYYIYRCLTGYTYDYVSSTIEIDKYINDLGEYDSQRDENSKLNIDYELTTLLVEQYCQCASTYSQNNKIKSGYFHSASASLLYAVIILAVSAFPFFVLKYQSPNQVQKVEITNFKEVNMSENKDKPDQKPQGQSTPNPVPPKPEPPKPAKPKIQSIKESDEKKLPKVITEEKPKPKQ